MSIQLYIAVVIALAVAGFVAGRWLLILVVFALWMTGLAIAGFAGVYHPTTEDSRGWLFYFAAWGSMFWVLAFMLGTALRRAIRWINSRVRRWRMAPAVSHALGRASDESLQKPVVTLTCLHAAQAIASVHSDTTTPPTDAASAWDRHEQSRRRRSCVPASIAGP